MKDSKKSVRTNELLVDILDYAFTEWLVRRGIFSAFKANFERNFNSFKSFHDCLRSRIRYSLLAFDRGPRHLIVSSFLFALTPEGDKFWRKQSAAWERFCIEFQAKL